MRQRAHRHSSTVRTVQCSRQYSCSQSGFSDPSWWLCRPQQRVLSTAMMALVTTVCIIPWMTQRTIKMFNTHNFVRNHFNDSSTPRFQQFGPTGIFLIEQLQSPSTAWQTYKQREEWNTPAHMGNSINLARMVWDNPLNSEASFFH